MAHGMGNLLFHKVVWIYSLFDFLGTVLLDPLPLDLATNKQYLGDALIV